jgi:hypothetical protein
MLLGPREFMDGLVKNKFSCFAENPNSGYQHSIPILTTLRVKNTGSACRPFMRFSLIIFYHRTLHISNGWSLLYFPPIILPTFCLSYCPGYLTLLKLITQQLHINSSLCIFLNFLFCSIFLNNRLENTPLVSFNVRDQVHLQ